MKSFYSDACTHNQHSLCNKEECDCGCHFIARNNGSSPEEWKAYQAKIKQAEESV
jgi:hypothetical protein